MNKMYYKKNETSFILGCFFCEKKLQKKPPLSAETKQHLIYFTNKKKIMKSFNLNFIVYLAMISIVQKEKLTKGNMAL